MFNEEAPIKSYSSHVLQHRKIKSWTRSDLAFHTGYSTSYLGGIERGELETTLQFVSITSKALGFSEYSSLVSYYKSNGYAKLGAEVFGNVWDYTQVIQQLSRGEYSIHAYWSASADYREFIADSEGSSRTRWEYKKGTVIERKTSVSYERMSEIFNSYWNPIYNGATLQEALEICAATDKPFYQLFAVCSGRYGIYDQNTVHIAATLNAYIEEHREGTKRQLQEKQTTYQIIVESFAEKAYLEDCLKLYRAHLRSKTD
ncbi:helix-turn-helix domain-containing protein [Saccharibacillus deserti]|uniref:helix-turn-helix domain-containing protein n=1 Tax=Saccharibacillus deserti TaxID=1634444 RepID=UPI0015545517|nr:helix-turn-helix transcriptional regulator [Saccharibacillus deserti]